MKKALITGIRGQDGAYLAKLLLKKGYEVWGADRRTGDAQYWRLEELGVRDQVNLVYMDLLEQSNIMKTIEKLGPDEFYNLGAQSFVGVSFDQPVLTSNIDGMGVLKILDAIKTIKPDTKFYQASTSEMFGKVQAVPQVETTPFYPRSPYGVAKLFAHWMTVNYREAYDLFACSGILFNHESPLRGPEFVTRKITMAVAAMKNGSKKPLLLGNLDAKRDWGYAEEYVEGMWRMLQHDTPDDFVLATGKTHSVKEFVEAAFEAAEIDLAWENDETGVNAKTGDTLVSVSPEFLRPAEVDLLLGSPQKAKDILGWEPKVSLQELVSMMVEADLRRAAESKSVAVAV